MAQNIVESENDIYENYLLSEFDALNTLIIRDDGKIADATKDNILEYLVFMFANGWQAGAYMLGSDAEVDAPPAGIVADSLYADVAGKTVEERIDEYLSLDDELSEERLKEIIRTDGHRMYIDGQFEYARQAEESGETITKTWDATLDEKTRETHFRLHGTEIGINDYFETVNGRALRPGEFGIGEEDCNCRCLLRLNRY